MKQKFASHILDDSRSPDQSTRLYFLAPLVTSLLMFIILANCIRQHIFHSKRRFGRRLNSSFAMVCCIIGFQEVPILFQMIKSEQGTRFAVAGTMVRIFVAKMKTTSSVCLTLIPRGLARKSYLLTADYKEKNSALPLVPALTCNDFDRERPRPASDAAV